MGGGCCGWWRPSRLSVPVAGLAAAAARGCRRSTNRRGRSTDNLRHGLQHRQCWYEGGMASPPQTASFRVPPRVALASILGFWAFYFAINTVRTAAFHEGPGELGMLGRRTVVSVFGEDEAMALPRKPIAACVSLGSTKKIHPVTKRTKKNCTEFFRFFFMMPVLAADLRL